MKLRLYKTLCFATDKNNLTEYNRNGYTVWLDHASYYPYATIQCRLAQAFFAAEFLAQIGDTSIFFIDVYASGYSLGKYKKDDPETCIDRICTWIEHMEMPNRPVVIRIYVYEEIFKPLQYGLSDHFNCLWPLKKSNNTSNYITLQEYENFGNPNNIQMKETRYNDGYDIISSIKEEAQKRNIKIIEVNYETPLSDAIFLISNSKAHFSYFGATYYIAAALGIKSYIFGYLSPEKRCIINHQNGGFLPSPWAGNIVNQYDAHSKKILCKSVDNFSFIDNVEHVKQILSSGL